MLKLNKALRRGSRNNDGDNGKGSREPKRKGYAMARALSLEETKAVPALLFDGDDVAEKKKKRDKRDGIDKAWFEGRMRALRIPSWAQVARDVGIEKSMLTRSLQGTRLFTASDVLLLSRTFNAPIEEIYRRVGYHVPKKGVPIVGVVKDDGQVSTVSPLKGKLFEVLDPPPGAQALIGDIKEGSTTSADGAMFIFVPSNDDNPAPMTAYGQLCVVEAEGHPMPLVGTIIKGQARGKLGLRLLSSNDVIQLDTVHRCSPIAMIVFP